MELRRTQRVTIQAICAVKNDTLPGAEPMPAVMLDLSIGGTLIESPKQLGIEGDSVSVATRLAVAQEERYLSLPGVIRSAQKMVKNTPVLYQYGIEFQTMNADTSLILHGFVYEQIVISLGG